MQNRHLSVQLSIVKSLSHACLFAVKPCAIHIIKISNAHSRQHRTFGYLIKLIFLLAIIIVWIGREEEGSMNLNCLSCIDSLEVKWFYAFGDAALRFGAMQLYAFRRCSFSF